MSREFSLNELAELLEMQPRTIRSYIEQDLLRGPELGGRGARYTDYHFTRLQAIRTLKDYQGLPLAEVRRRLLSVTGPELASLASEWAATRTPARPLKPGSALAYIRSLNQTAPPNLPTVSAAESSAVSSTATSTASSTPMDSVLARLDRIAAGNRPARRSRSEVWVSVPVTPDVEIRVRGTQTVEQIAKWERIADHLRELLMGVAQGEGEEE